MLPQKAIDMVNTVLVVDLKNGLQTDSLRYVATNIELTRLLAFDAIQQGKGFGFGDGKKDKYYVEGWTSKAQSLSWKFRTTTPTNFNMAIKYLAPAVSSGGQYAVLLDEMYIQNPVSTDANSAVTTQSQGTFFLPAGIHQLKIQPLTISKKELMKLLEVQLVPVAKRSLSLNKIFADAETQTQVMLYEIPKAQAAKSGATSGVTPGSASSELVSPRTLENEELKLVSSKDWTSGFFPGELWLLYEYTGKKEWKEVAEKYTANIEREKFNGGTHDMGFKIYCSFGQGYRLTKDAHQKEVIIQAAKTLSTRFNPVTGVIRSWDNRAKWRNPVIIDNMMNLELLFAATRLTGDSLFYKIAVSHATKTMQNHYRKDYSSYHVVDYDTLTGKVLQRTTHQGFSDESEWARGQAWGLYGFTMCYRETKNKAFLQQAENIAAYLLKHPNMPNDLVPYWDFNAPNIPGEPRDASAAAVMASALYELGSYSKNGKQYRQAADKIVESLTNTYRSPIGENKGFLLLHSTGAKPSNSEVDVPLSYADYYYLEALLRKQKLEGGKKVELITSKNKVSKD